MTGRSDEGRFVVERCGQRFAVCDLTRPSQQLTVHDTRGEQAQREVDASPRRNARTTRTGRTLR